uniref:RNA-dependent RNA polymerase n=1 Tax=Kalanchoe fedtschenkoi TaxID=63787 RepID=A0A7N0V2Y6_KALFE
MELEGKENEKAVVVTQVSIGGFDRHVKAKELMTFLEDTIGLVWRCRLKTSWTPRESFPDYQVEIDKVGRGYEFEKGHPHAFVHFATPESATKALDISGQNKLIFDRKVLRVSLGPENAFHKNQRRRTITPHKFPDVCLDLGVLASRDDFVAAWKARSGVQFLIDPFDATCKFLLTKDVIFSSKDDDGRIMQAGVIKCDLKVEFLARNIYVIKECKDLSSLVILVQLNSSPSIYYRTADDDIEVSVPFDLLDDDDPWVRTTDFTPNGAFGRCNSFRVALSPRYGLKLKKALEYLRGCRVPIEQPKQLLGARDEPGFGVPSTSLFFSIQSKANISFEILFLVNCVLHKGIVNQHQLSERFFDLLRSQPGEVNLAALKHMYSYKHPLFDACKRLEDVQRWLVKNPKLVKSPNLPDDIVEVRRFVITPTSAYCLPPEVELSNRVLRHFKHMSDRFLRVTFMDEGMQSMNNNVLNFYMASIIKDIDRTASFTQKTSVYKRVCSYLKGGIHLCGRRYAFLAFSSNQLRDSSAWFFAEDDVLTAIDVIKWMGKFNARNVAKCAARMGQCFSSTYATVEVPRSQVLLSAPDIERNNYVFSDGIGTMTPDLALEVAENLKLEKDPPCAFQIRYGGCKGVIACWPGENDGVRMKLRTSMVKFLSRHTALEVCSWTRFQPGFLNRQIVTLLSALGVVDDIFWDMQETMISKLNHMLVDADVAFDVLMASCAEQGNTAAIMLSAGFRPQTEPHLAGMLTCVRAAQLWGLREKARIFVPKGRWLMGVLDELAVLEQGQCFIQVSSPKLENCFLKHGSRFSQTQKSLQVVEGYVVVAKNPCLHPGDVRILEAVDAPGLHHLTDCLVFPQKGERPHTNEASGSDLDGDLYFVTWDEKLIPPSKRSWTPMEYDTQKPKEMPRQIVQADIIDFFARNMVNENLGAICNAHVVHADRSDYGAFDENCIKLAELAATAVDFPKTGKLVAMPGHLKPKLYPDFMGKQPFQTYKSNKILGRLYRRIKDSYDSEITPYSEAGFSPGKVIYDRDLEVPGLASFIADAWSQKCVYDGQVTGLMAQYKVTREEEIVTGHVWSMPKSSSKKQGDLKERLKHAYSSLRKEFRHVFENLDRDTTDLLGDEERNRMLEQKASAWYHVTYHPEWVKRSLDRRGPSDSGEDQLPLSFAWIAADYLARIKIRHTGLAKVGSTKPVASLAKYLAEMDLTCA